MNEYLLKLIETKVTDVCHFIINDRYSCVPYYTCYNDIDTIDDNIDKKLFPDWIKDNNSCQLSTSLKVCIYDIVENMKRHGEFFIFKNDDLIDSIKLSAAIFIDSNKQLNVVKIEKFKPLVTVKDFMKLIKYKPDNKKLREPSESCGLSIVEFDGKNGYEANIEFGDDGRLYYEVLDMRNYKDGEFIPLSSEMRHDIIAYEFLSEYTIQSLADRINASLDKMYNIKKEI